MLSGWKTLLFNCLAVMVPTFLQWVLSIDWTQYLAPQMAIVLMGVANMALRFVTSTPVFKAAKK